MDRKAKIARTAHDKDNVNRLRVPEFGVIKLCLTIGGKFSKSYLPDGIVLPKGVTKPAEDGSATDNFHFAPEKEKIKITYRIDDPLANVTKATLELFRRNEATAVWKKDLKPAEFVHSVNKDLEIEWDGKIDKSTEFPMEFITVQHSPYKLKLTLEGDDGYGYGKTAWTFFHVLLHELKLELGLKDALSDAKDKALYDVLKDHVALKDCIPASTSATKKEVKLISNLFKTSSAEMSNGTAYTQYKTLWDEGPRIPIFVKATVKTSDDKEADVPKAIGKVKLLWEWEDDPEDVTIHFTEAKEFVELAIDRYKATTKPKGDNCHKDHGGKRGDATKYVFPAQAGYDPKDVLTPDTFPFKVEKGTTRTWSAYSYSWASGKLVGQSGVMFQPARMAGDAYKLNVYFPHNRTWDGKDDLDDNDDKMLKHAVKASTGAFQVWREVHIVKYCKKANTIPSINLGTVAGYYSKAYIKIEDKTAGTISAMANYDTKLRAALNGQADYRKEAVKAGDQGTITKSAIKFIGYGAWKTAVQTLKVWNNVQLNNWLSANGFDTQNGYEELLEAITDAIVPTACDSYMSGSDGINIMQFDLYWEADGGLSSGTNGFAATFPSNTRNKAAYIQSRVNYGGGHNNMQQTTTHEIGHILFLPHAPGTGGAVPAFHDEDAHWHNCTMSYNYNQERKFCGLCLLRLRGWDQTNLKSDRTQNKKP